MFGFGGKKPRQFNYKPRFFNPEEEERERRKRFSDIDLDAKDDKYIPGSIVQHERIKRMTISEQEKALKNRSSKMRLIIFMILLILAAYFLLTFTGFETIVKAFRGE